jgi:SAM-dependent methyltransferase
MSGPAYARFYNAVYRPLVSAYHGRTIDARTIQDEQREYATAMEPFIERYLTGRQAVTLLDVGGSTGVVAGHLAQRFSLKATVLDPAADEIAEAHLRGLETITSLVEDWDPGPRRFDLVGMFQTIDHLQDIRATLDKIRAVIDENGTFVVDIVDFRAVYLRNWSVDEAVKIDHPFSLTEETAEAFLARAGFGPVGKMYAADGYHVAYACRPCAPNPRALPSPAAVTRFLREVRFVQNTPRPLAHPVR